MALAGGAGAFFGAGLGQVLQWRRDVWLAGKEDQRRREDADREAVVARRAVRLNDYQEALKFLHSFRGDLEFLRTAAFASSSGDERIEALLEEAWGKARLNLSEPLSATLGRVDVVGSDGLRDTFERLRLLSAAFVTDVRDLERHNLRSGAIEQIQAAAARGEPVDLLEYSETVAIGSEERAEEIDRIVDGLLEIIDESRGIIRQELDLHD